MTDKIFTYVTCRRGYRAGGINTPGFSAVLAPFQYFGPQKVNDVEIGAKTQWSVGTVRGRFNIAAFRGVFSSLQRQDRKSVVSGKSVSVRLDLGGRRISKTKRPKQLNS